MKTIYEIQKQLKLGQFYFSHHAFKRSIERDISEDEIKEVGENARIIEDYSNDKYTTSCLLLGFTKMDRPLHIQVSLKDSDETKIITIYQPDKTKWINFLQRR